MNNQPQEICEKNGAGEEFISRNLLPRWERDVNVWTKVRWVPVLEGLTILGKFSNWGSGTKPDRNLLPQNLPHIIHKNNSKRIIA